MKLNSLIISAYNAIDIPVVVLSKTNNIVFRNAASIDKFGMVDFEFKIPFKGVARLDVGGNLCKFEVSTSVLEMGNSESVMDMYVVLLKPMLQITSRYQSEFDEIEMVGKGGFGSVWKVVNKTDRQTYAIKKIPIMCSDSRSGTSCNSSATLHSGELDKALQEARIMAKVGDHPNIVKYYNSWVENDLKGGTVLYIQMQYYDSFNLREYIQDRKRLDSTKSLDLFHQICQAVSHLHAKGVVHLDIKPENILLDNGIVRISDFGSALFENEIFALESKESGSYFYTSPEVQVSTKSDIYALGIVLLELFSKFGTGMERNVVLESLKNRHKIPVSLCKSFPLVAELVKELTNSNGIDRPTIEEIQNHEVFSGRYGGLVLDTEELTTSDQIFVFESHSDDEYASFSLNRAARRAGSTRRLKPFHILDEHSHSAGILGPRMDNLDILPMF